AHLLPQRAPSREQPVLELGRRLLLETGGEATEKQSGRFGARAARDEMLELRDIALDAAGDPDLVPVAHHDRATGGLVDTMQELPDAVTHARSVILLPHEPPHARARETARAVRGDDGQQRELIRRQLHGATVPEHLRP